MAQTRKTDAKITTGLKLALRFCKFPDGRIVYGPEWANDIAKAIDSALQQAATHAMEAERERILQVIDRKCESTCQSYTPMQLSGVLKRVIDGPNAVKPTKGATK